MRALPATLRAIALDPRADPERAAGIRVLSWQSQEEFACPRWTSAVHRDGRTVATIAVTSLADCCYVVIMRRGRGGPGRPRYFTTLAAAVAAAETVAVAHALGLRVRPAAV
ncbi:hypothetical protein [Aureimonas sp. AU40]|uniref:hypothetical protein n=1 Tax=Aureimonas sp. AU40 TaxID=1637747 RepID=UPI0007854A7C|nr:hypothetical protein [Aureimonas sp. AU40]